jgi:uncharacterized protein (DUF1778 family)
LIFRALAPVAQFDLLATATYIGEKDGAMSEQLDRTESVEARLSRDALVVIERAAEIEGRSVSEFIADAAEKAAHKTVEETTMIRLAVEDQRRMWESLLNPPEPNEALRRAAQRHRELFGKI